MLQDRDLLRNGRKREWQYVGQASKIASAVGGEVFQQLDAGTMSERLAHQCGRVGINCFD